MYELTIPFPEDVRFLKTKVNSFFQYLQLRDEWPLRRKSGIVDRLLENVASYRGKDTREVSFDDLFIVYGTVQTDLKHRGIHTRSIRNWKRGKNFGTFSYKQYELLEKYVQGFSNPKIDRQFF
ncbi:hypothetical protein HOD29_01790 [archaeon]|jgi:hypothetical protein|nr:hypothetical protein [archaeon]